MMNSINLKKAIVAMALPLALGSCSKNQLVEPASQSVSANAEVQVVNGRVVFKDDAVFIKSLNSLEQIESKRESSKSFDSWEQDLKFTSLRKIANQEREHLEELDSQNIPASAYALMEGFGLPISYAAFLNPAGEYQIGQKIYWFHEGFKYQADSEAELAAIKQNPLEAKIKTIAGSYTIKSGKLGAISGGNKFPFRTNTTVASSPYADGRYVSEFFLNNDPNSKRRTIYDIQVFNDDLGTYNNGTNNGKHYRSSIRLQIKYEYYARRNNAWYPAQGQTFIYQIKTNFSGKLADPSQAQAVPTITSSQNESWSTGDGYYSTLLGSAEIFLNNYNGPGYINWTFDLNGGISGYPQQDQPHIYTIGNMNTYPTLY